MNENPLVTIMMPAHNSGSTIGFAISSLLAQTYKNWECIVVDDGSSDDTFIQAAAIRDARIVIHCQKKNMGSAAARQVVLERARGDLLAMLDADDWLYPDKLARQVELIQSNEDVFLVSCGMAITDVHDDLVGVRATGRGEEESYLVPGKLPVAHAPSVLRTRDLKSFGYDEGMRMAADSDFLRRSLLGKRFIVMPYVGYCYRELGSARLGKIIAGYYYNARGLAKFFKARPLPIGWLIAKEMAKILIYLASYPFGSFRALIRMRSRAPSEAERTAFLEAKAAVQAVYDRILSEKAS